ncbi:MAG: DNA-formamidopyrimidine glycosylase family protein [Candidatus Nanopelagicales bacterium]
MPEGHSLHRLARSLNRGFAKHAVEASSPQGRFAAGAALLDGRVLEQAEAWGKHLFVRFEGEQVLHVHLGLYGTWVRAKAPSPPPWGALRLRIENDAWYADLRGPTACDLVGEEGRARIIARLGPDPLRKDADGSRMVERIGRSRAPVGAMLMDQSVVAGIGNIYRAELLHRHGVSPFVEGRALPEETVSAMWDDIVVLMKDGVRRGRIVTVDPDDVARLGELDHDRPAADDPDLDGGEDTQARRRLRRSTGSYVYRRDGRPCLRCGTTIAVMDFHGRRLYWCPGCQT